MLPIIFVPPEFWWTSFGSSKGVSFDRDMANSFSVKRLGAKWAAIRSRWQAVALLRAFAKANLADVPRDVTAIPRALKRKGDICVLIVEGEWRVFRVKPKGKIKRAAKPRDEKMTKVMASIMPDMLAYTVDRDDKAVGRIVRKLKLGLSRDVALPALRTAIWATFVPALCEDLAHEFPSLAEGSRDMGLPCEPGLDIEGDDPKAHVLRYVARRGVRGAGRADMLKGIRPYLGAKVVASALVALEDEYLVVSCECIPGNIGRKRDVYFLAEHGLPTLEANGSYSILH